MIQNILVDSNVFISLLKSKGDPRPCLAEWAGERNLVICGMVRLEVLRGIRSEKSLRSLSAFMDLMVNIPTNQRIWDDAILLASKMDRKSFVISATDAVIAASALRIGAAIMTSDAHFLRVDGLEVIAPPVEWIS
jgi:predicted nucleic acid-binding protein